MWPVHSGSSHSCVCVQARRCHAHYWPVTDLLSAVLLALDDLTGEWVGLWLSSDSTPSPGCLQLINEVLPHCPHFPRGRSHDLPLMSHDQLCHMIAGLAYLHHLADSSPDLLTFMPRLRL